MYCDTEMGALPIAPVVGIIGGIIGGGGDKARQEKNAAKAQSLYSQAVAGNWEAAFFLKVHAGLVPPHAGAGPFRAGPGLDAARSFVAQLRSQGFPIDAVNNTWIGNAAKQATWTAVSPYVGGGDAGAGVAPGVPGVPPFLRAGVGGFNPLLLIAAGTALYFLTQQRRRR